MRYGCQELKQDTHKSYIPMVTVSLVLQILNKGVDILFNLNQNEN